MLLQIESDKFNMEYEFFVFTSVDKATMESLLPREVFEEVASLSPLAFFAFPKEEKSEKEEEIEKIEKIATEPIGYAFFLPENPARLIWIEVGEEYYGSNLAHSILEYAEAYLGEEGISGIFTALYGDYFSTYRGNTFLNKNDFDVVKQNKRLITYKKRHFSTSPGMEILRKWGEKLCTYVVPLDNNNHKHQIFLFDNVGDIRTERAEYIDPGHSFVYIKENKVEGAAVSIRRGESEVFVADFCVAKGPHAAEATKGLLVTLLEKCVGNRGLSFITKNESQRSLLIHLIGDPDKDVPYWEYYKGFDGRGDDLDG